MSTAEKQDAPWALLGTTGLAVFAVFLDTTVLFVAFASISADYPSVSPAGMSWPRLRSRWSDLPVCPSSSRTGRT
jgi:hypothetical protein